MLTVKNYDEDIIYEYEKGISVFDRINFYKLDEIYLIYQGEENYTPVVLTGFEDSLNWENNWENNWSKKKIDICL